MGRWMFPENPTRTAETVSLYLRRAKNLIKRAAQDLKLQPGEALDARQFAAWLVDLRPDLAPASWRQYKSAAICFLEQCDDDASGDALDFLRQQDSATCAKDTQKTSSTKLKRFPWRDFQKLTDYLREHNGKWHRPLLDWIISASLTGLRPQEWLGCELSEIANERALLVRNAKRTNGRSHGETRTLLLGDLADEEIETLRRHLERIRIWSGMSQFPEFYSGCALTLHYVSRKLWPRRQKHVTLYSCRHQFTANAKASGFSTAEIAAMMGHAVDTTATRHYGKKAAGHELLRVRAPQAEIDRVRQKFSSTMAGQKALTRKSPMEPQPKILAGRSAPQKTPESPSGPAPLKDN